MVPGVYVCAPPDALLLRAFLKNKRERVLILVAFYTERCCKFFPYPPFMRLMAFQTRYIHMPVMSSDGLLICMAVAETVDGRRLEFSVRLVTAFAIKLAHGSFLGYVFMTSHTLLFLWHCGGLAIYVTA